MKRSPKGYSIKQWADGTWHAYHGGTCLDECITRADAIAVVWDHKLQDDKSSSEELNGLLTNHINESRLKSYQEA